MKLFLYDEKHEQILDSMEITNYQQAQSIIYFLENTGVTNRYKKLVLAKEYSVGYDDDGEREVFFEYGGN